MLPGKDVIEGVLCIPRSSSITEALLSNCLVSYPEYPFGEGLTLCRDAVGVFYSLSRLGNMTLAGRFLLLCSDAVDVLDSSSQLGQRILVGECLTPLHSCSRCLPKLQPIGQKNTRGGGGAEVGTLCRDAVGVF